MNDKSPNQIHRELLGVAALNPFVGHDSSARLQMFCQHISQTLVVSGATEKNIQTGMEREYGKYTFSIKTPGDENSQGGIQVIKVIERYPSKVGIDAIKLNPQTILLYEDVATKEVGVINIPTYCSYHQYFGFQYKPTTELASIRTGSMIPAGTVLMNSPAITENGDYKYGVECNMAFMSHPSVSEDGIMISRDVLHKFRFKTYETRVVEWGNKRFPLNLYGDKENYKPFPDIGDRIRNDGILMALRAYDKDLAVVEQNINDLCTPDMIFDRLTYAGGPGGKVIDIRVHHNIHDSQSLGMNMDAQADKYNSARYEFYQSIIDEYHRLRKNRGDNLRITPELHRLIVEALAVLDNDQQKLIRLYRQTPLDDYRIEFVIEYDNEPDTGYKLTDTHGGKGVVCYIAEPEEMPVDLDGNRADIVMDPNSTISRMNIGRLYEQYINAASRDIVKKMISDLGIDKNDKILKSKLEDMEDNNFDMFNRSWDYLMSYYKIVSPKMFIWFTDGEYKDRRSSHLLEVIKNGIRLYMPPSNEPESEEIIKELEKHFRPTFGPVSFVNKFGKLITTVNPILIGSCYMLLLEKTADDWTAVSSGKLQHFGVLSQVTNTDKYTQPSRNQAIRALGESEIRIYVSYCGSEITSDIMDRNNNPETHKQVVRSILTADKPTDIPIAVNRKLTPIGMSRPLVLVKHMCVCSGYRFVYRPHKQ